MKKWIKIAGLLLVLTLPVAMQGCTEAPLFRWTGKGKSGVLCPPREGIAEWRI